jgi:predicted DCC family thiol-disulfide oxidoreductase YuxK
VVAASYAIVLFDGECGLCDRSIDFLLRHDRAEALRFAPLQSDVAQSLLREHGLDATQVASVVVIDRERVYRQSDAALLAAEKLGPWWRGLATIARLVPRAIRDAVYDLIARNRYRWFGRTITCRIPTPQERTRFLVS